MDSRRGEGELYRVSSVGDFRRQRPRFKKRNEGHPAEINWAARLPRLVKLESEIPVGYPEWMGYEDQVLHFYKS